MRNFGPFRIFATRHHAIAFRHTVSESDRRVSLSRGWCAASVAELDWWTFHGAERAKYATVPGSWFQPFATATAVVKEQARIRRHRLTALLAAMWASKHGFEHDHTFCLGTASRMKATINHKIPESGNAKASQRGVNKADVVVDVVGKDN